MKIGISREELVRRLQANGVEVDIPGSPPLHSLPLFTSDQWKIAGWSKAPVVQDQFPNADDYNAGTLSIPTLTGPDDEGSLLKTIDGFKRVWDDLRS